MKNKLPWSLPSGSSQSTESYTHRDTTATHCAAACTERKFPAERGEAGSYHWLQVWLGILPQLHPPAA